ncbi:MAG: hypothetical protein ACOC1K_08320 [Nanoarchaeota archaeon]
MKDKFILIMLLIITIVFLLTGCLDNFGKKDNYTGSGNLKIVVEWDKFEDFSNNNLNSINFNDINVADNNTQVIVEKDLEKLIPGQGLNMLMRTHILRKVWKKKLLKIKA